MSLARQLETVVEVKASAAQIHEVFSCRPYIVSITNPERVQSCELMEGEWGKEGSVICWRLTRDGSDPNTVKELVELIDNENFVTIYKLIEASVLDNYYKNFYSIAKIAPKDEEGSLVYWTYKYEKQNEDVLDLEDIILQMAINVIKNIDAYLLTQMQA